MNIYCQRIAKHSEIKCNGLMEWSTISEVGEHVVEVLPCLRCVRCGDIVDGKILYNRLRSKNRKNPNPKRLKARKEK